MHGGSVTARSAGLDRGSEFIVRLPTVEEERAAGRTASSREGQRRGGRTVVPRRIMIVDDSKDTADVLAMLLRLAGHDVHTS